MKISRAFIVFVAIGGFASLVNLVARLLINRVTSYELAIALAFPIATLTAFVLNRLFVFKATGRGARSQFARFLFVNILSLGQVFLVTELFARVILPALGLTWHGDTVAHAIGLLSPLLTSYWAHKHFSFAADRVRVPDPVT